MTSEIKTKLTVSGALLLTATLTGCGTFGSMSNNIAPNGRSAENLVWPAPDQTTPMHKGGTFPNIANLKLIHRGMTKSQIKQLIGPPHFNEGIMGVREWNYLFNFRNSDTGNVAQCEYKILFNNNGNFLFEKYRASSFYWHPKSCAARVNPQKKTVSNLSADALFGFDQYRQAAMKPKGRQELRDLADKISRNESNIRSIRITGYTDRLGSAAYNKDLSKNRARTVMHYLANHGIPADLMTAKGLGETNPVKTCSNKQQAALITCLAPNRRVQVTVYRSAD